LKSFLELRDVFLNYGKIEALRGVSIALEQGKIIALVGLNGAGKSTVLKSIMGLEQINSGEILFAGEKINGKHTPEIVRMGVAICPEGRRVFPDMGIMRNLMAGAYLRKDHDGVKRQLNEVFEFFPILNERQHQRAGKLSGGEQQMLAIGRALMAGPRLLLMDEPTLGLAPLVVEELSTIIKNILERGVSIILAEQNARWALELAQYGFVLENGKIIKQGSYEELLSDMNIRQIYMGG
jgi:branched-chain amino acid transport system ATP-binding protein